MLACPKPPKSLSLRSIESAFSRPFFPCWDGPECPSVLPQTLLAWHFHNSHQPLPKLLVWLPGVLENLECFSVPLGFHCKYQKVYNSRMKAYNSGSLLQYFILIFDTEFHVPQDGLELLILVAIPLKLVCNLIKNSVYWVRLETFLQKEIVM